MSFNSNLRAQSVDDNKKKTIDARVKTAEPRPKEVNTKLAPPPVGEAKEGDPGATAADASSNSDNPLQRAESSASSTAGGDGGAADNGAASKDGAGGDGVAVSPLHGSAAGVDTISKPPASFAEAPPGAKPCENCGQMLGPGFAFCALCGTKKTPPTTDDNGGASSNPPTADPAAAAVASEGSTAAPEAPTPTPVPKPSGAWSFGLSVGPSATKDCVRFVGCFAPLGDANAGGLAESLRDAAFKAADPNGNGHCSLAELETWVLQVLVAKYPRVGKGKDMKEPGKDLFTTFRPSYLRAFSDAKDYQADSGAKIKGAKNATDDSFVQKGEFRLFCCYLCIYATMYDAFSRLDGGSKGRDHNDDLRLEQSEFEVIHMIFYVNFLLWYRKSLRNLVLQVSIHPCMHACMAGLHEFYFNLFCFLSFSQLTQASWKRVNEYGFVCLQSMSSKSDAKKVFQAMDANGGGIVLLDEFCKYLKACEIAAGTEMGSLLQLDEEGGVGKEEILPDFVVKHAKVKPGANPPVPPPAPDKAPEAPAPTPAPTPAPKVEVPPPPVVEAPKQEVPPAPAPVAPALKTQATLPEEEAPPQPSKEEAPPPPPPPVVQKVEEAPPPPKVKKDPLLAPPEAEDDGVIEEPRMLQRKGGGGGGGGALGKQKVSLLCYCQKMYTFYTLVHLSC